MHDEAAGGWLTVRRHRFELDGRANLDEASLERVRLAGVHDHWRSVDLRGRPKAIMVVVFRCHGCGAVALFLATVRDESILISLR